MPFQKGNKLGAQKKLDIELDPRPLSLLLRVGAKEELREVEGWRDKLRVYIDELIEGKNE